MDTLQETETIDNLIKENPKSEYKSPSRLMLIVGGIILLVLGLVVGYYLSSSSKAQTSYQTTSSPIPSPEAGDEMEGWKTYSNKEYGFEFEYPGDLEIHLSNSQDPPINDIVYLVVISSKDYSEDITVRIFQGYDLEEYVTKVESELFGLDARFEINTSDTLIGEYSGKRVDYYYSDSPQKIFSMFIFFRSDFIYEITSRSGNRDQILSTFKFVDKAQELSTVSGKLCYPSEYLPQGNIVAKDIETKELFTQKYPGSDNGGKSTFDMELPEGTYIFRYEAGVNENKPDEFLAGYYTQCATITDRGCLDTEHQLIQVQVSNQSVAESISLCDFYYGAEPDF